MFFVFFTLMTQFYNVSRAEASLKLPMQQWLFVDTRDWEKSTDASENLWLKQLNGELSSNPCLFLKSEDGICSQKINWTRTGPLGPLGEYKKGIWFSTKQRKETRENTIMSAHVEWIIHSSSKKIERAQILLFVHDQQRSPSAYYFRRLEITFKPSQQIQEVHIIKDIPLLETKFSFYVDIAERKTIIVDEQNGITKVIPVAVGAFDIMPLTSSQTLVKNTTPTNWTAAKIQRGQPAGLHRQRLDKSMYRERPFLGIADKDGTEYRQIGWHYKMTEDELTRAFQTHGCLRAEDKDLYQMAAIVFEGNASGVDVRIVESFLLYPDLQKFVSLDHPLPKENSWFLDVQYGEASIVERSSMRQVHPRVTKLRSPFFLSPTEQYLWCAANSGLVAEEVEDGPLGLRQSGDWVTLLDHLCMTKITKVRESVVPVVEAYIHPEKSPSPPASLLLDISFAITDKEICDVNFAEAQTFYKEKMNGGILTYKKYLANCGCGKFALRMRSDPVLNRGVPLPLSEKEKTVQLFCPGY